jgi:hypothetical protein
MIKKFARANRRLRIPWFDRETEHQLPPFQDSVDHRRWLVYWD